MTTRKRSRRYETELYALWRGEGAVQRVLIEDFSETGCRVADTLAADVGSEVILEFFLNEDPEQGPTRVFADVVRRESDGVGLLFSEMTDEAREEIEFFLFEHFAKESSSAIPIAPAGPPIAPEPTADAEVVSSDAAAANDFFFGFGAGKVNESPLSEVSDVVDVSAIDALSSPQISPFDALPEDESIVPEDNAQKEQAAREQAAKEEIAKQHDALRALEAEHAEALAAKELAAREHVARVQAIADEAVREKQVLVEAAERELEEKRAQTKRKRDNDELIIVEGSDPGIPVRAQPPLKEVEENAPSNSPQPDVQNQAPRTSVPAHAVHRPEPLSHKPSSSWPTYALVIAGLVGLFFLLQQCAS